MLHSFKPKEEKKSKDFDLDEEEEVEERPLYLADFLSRLVANPARSDVTFQVSKGDKKESIPGHRIILAASSKLFEAMLYPVKGPDGERPKVTLPLTVNIRDTDPAVFKLLLQCVYTDHVDIDPAFLGELINISHKYQIEKLQLACTEFMEKDVNAENALELFEIAPTLLGDEEFALPYIRENTADVLETEAFLKLSPARLKYLLADEGLGADESILFIALQKWAKAQATKKGDELKGSETDKVKEIVKDYLPLIRFPTMGLEDIATHVAPSGFLDEKQMLQLYQFCALRTDEEKDKFTIDFPTGPRSGGRKLKFTSIGDTGGLFYFIGTNEGKGSYSNPITAGKATVTQSSKGGSDMGSLADRNMVSPTVENSYGSDVNPWLAIKFRDYLLRVTELVVCMDQDHILQNWRLEGKYEGGGQTSWATIGEFKNDTSLTSASPHRAVFKFKSTKFYQEFRIYVTGPGHKGAANYDFTELEFYGYHRKIK